MLLAGLWLLVSVTVIFFALLSSKLHNNWRVNYVLQYGKLKNWETRNVVARTLEIPKRWFFHFYLLGSIVNAVAAFNLWHVYINGSSPPLYLAMLDEYLHAEFSIDGSTSIVLVVMMLLQNLRRLYECLYVNVFSEGRMNILHYGAGLLLYATFHIVVMVGGPVLRDHTNYAGGRFNITWWQTLGFTLFFWSSWQQHQVHQYLASLRKTRKGEVRSYQHYLPVGGWFELVSCPHYLMEILIYTSFVCVSGGRHLTLLCTVLFVYTNQLVAGCLTHSWYRQHFHPYPAHRKAILPYVL